MKKYLMLLILPLLLFGTIPNVYADGEDAPWPKVFQITDENLQYLIEGISLEIYQADENSEQLTINNNNGTTNMTQDEKNYLDRQKTRTVDLSPTDYSISPVYKKDKFYSVDTLYIDINLNLTKEKIEALIADEIQNTTASKHYIVDVCVKYQLQSYPEKFKYMYQIDYMRYIVQALMGQLPSALSKNTTYSQVLNRGVTLINDQTSQKSFSYTKEFTPDNLFYYTDFTILSENEKKAGIYTNQDEANAANKDDLYIFFHDLDNVDELIADVKEESTPTTNPNTNPGNNPITSYQPNEVVKAEDTGAFTSYYIYIIGGLFLIIGLGLFGKIIFKKGSTN